MRGVKWKPRRALFAMHSTSCPFVHYGIITHTHTQRTHTLNDIIRCCARDGYRFFTPPFGRRKFLCVFVLSDDLNRVLKVDDI